MPGVIMQKHHHTRLGVITTIRIKVAKHLNINQLKRKSKDADRKRIIRN